MLVRCPKCGKPVYFPDGEEHAECGYCYNNISLSESMTEIRPENIDWKKPIDDLTRKTGAIRDQGGWLAFLGDYADAPRRLERLRAAELKKVKVSEDRIRIATESRRVEQIIRDLENIDTTLCDAETVERVLAAAREKRGLLQEEEDRIEARKAKRNKRIKRIIWMLPIAGVICLIAFGMWSFYVDQPAQLKKAGELEAAAKYDEAELLYESLLSENLTRNPSVKTGAREALKELRNRKAERLAEQGDLEMAVREYELAENQDAARRTRQALAEELEEKKRYAEAIEQWEQLSGAEEKIAELYARLAVQRFEEGNYEQALAASEQADPKIMAESRVSEQDIYLRWGESLADQGRIDEAIQVLRKAVSSGKVSEQIQALYVRLADEKGKQVIAQWEREKGTEQNDAKWMQTFAATGDELQTVDAMLHYWGLLSASGIDLTQVWPEGAEIMDLEIPIETTDFETNSLDVTKPLVFLKREKDYSLLLQDWRFANTGWPVHDPGTYTIRLLPELWQRLPEERRATSLRDCVCILIMNLAYDPAGSFLGVYYDETVTYTKVKELIEKSPWPNLAYFPLYTARMEMQIWKYPGTELRVVRRKTEKARLDGSSDGPLVVDWTKQESGSASATELGLSGVFDEIWIAEILENYYQFMLKLGGD